MTRLILASTAAVALTTVAATGAGFETPPTLRAAELAPQGVVLKGERYAVDPTVPTDGLLATFTIRSDFGTVKARGPGMLQQRLAEVEALARLEQMKKSDVFLESLKKSASSMGQALVGVVTNPVETAKAIPEGVGRFLERTARAAKTGAQKLGDVKDGREAGAPRTAEQGQALGGGTPTSKPASTQDLAVATAVAAGRATRDILGYDEKRRDLARQLRVDPYTTNPILTKQLDEVAWAAFAGGLGVDVLATKVPGGRVVKSTSLVTDWIYEKPPGDLRVWIDKTLKSFGVDQETIDLFLRHRHFNLTAQVTLVMALDKMAGVGGRAEVLETAVTAENEDQARFLALGFTMLVREHAKSPLREIIDGRPVGMTRAGRAVATMPLDYVTWTARTAAFCDREDLRPHRPYLLLAGRLSERTRAELRARGWEVTERAAVIDGL